MRRIGLLFVVVTLVSCLWAADNQVQLPKDLPAYGPLKPMSTPDMKQMQLPNGLTVWLVPRPGYPKVRFLVTVRGGFAADPKEQPGISEFLTSTLTEGTKTRTARQIAEQMQAAGGELRAQANTDDLSLGTTVLAAKYEPALTVLADVAQNASFPDAEVEIARTGLLNSLQRRQSEATYMARRALAAAMFGDHPYSVIGPTQETIKKSTVADLRAEYARRFRPDQALLIVVGAFDVDAMMKAVQQKFGAWQAGSGTPVPQTAAPQQGGKATVFVVPRANSVQTRYFIATLGPVENDPDWAAAQVATMVYGSRVSKNVREDKGYAYSSGAQPQLLKEANMLLTAASVRNEVTGPSWNEMSYEMNRIATTSPTKQEVDRVGHFLIGYDAVKLQAQTELAAKLARLWINGLPSDQLGREGQDLEKVTIADVQRIGRKYLPSAQMTIVAVGDEKAITEQLAPFGLEMKILH